MSELLSSTENWQCWSKVTANFFNCCYQWLFIVSLYKQRRLQWHTLKVRRWQQCVIQFFYDKFFDSHCLNTLEKRNFYVCVFFFIRRYYGHYVIDSYNFNRSNLYMLRSMAVTIRTTNTCYFAYYMFPSNHTPHFHSEATQSKSVRFVNKSNLRKRKFFFFQKQTTALEWFNHIKLRLENVWRMQKHYWFSNQISNWDSQSINVEMIYIVYPCKNLYFSRKMKKNYLNEHCTLLMRFLILAAKCKQLHLKCQKSSNRIPNWYRFEKEER